MECSTLVPVEEPSSVVADHIPGTGLSCAGFIAWHCWLHCLTWHGVSVGVRLSLFSIDEVIDAVLEDFFVAPNAVEASLVELQQDVHEQLLPRVCVVQADEPVQQLVRQVAAQHAAPTNRHGPRPKGVRHHVPSAHIGPVDWPAGHVQALEARGAPSAEQRTIDGNVGLVLSRVVCEDRNADVGRPLGSHPVAEGDAPAQRGLQRLGRWRLQSLAGQPPHALRVE
mmetsp:Transcript_99086/g.275903  ORF Transcript_99086/g.275903 Transcript_99086/m.275903 type:complete len:225 (+) Transcript_99086:834-1508(+)